MKKLVPLHLSLILIGFLAALAPACNEAPRGDNATIMEKQDASEAKGATYIVDTASSKIRFTGHGVGKNHPGKFRISSGSVALSGGEITGGNFLINIKSMELEQKGGMFDSKLRPHLMSSDFFDADKFSSAIFEITKVAPYTPDRSDKTVVERANCRVSGNFTLKGITKNITFPARIDVDGNTLKAAGIFNIDRRQWNMNYGNDQSLGDKFISETVNIELDLMAKKP